MSYQRTFLQGMHFDERLRGAGAQVHNDMAFSLAVKRAGWKLIYDPAVAVNHYPAPCLDEDQRHRFSAEALSDMVHNETLILLEYLLPLRRLAFAVWALFVGTRSAFGVVQWLRFLPHEGRLAGMKLRASLKGRVEGWRTWRRHHNA